MKLIRTLFGSSILLLSLQLWGAASVDPQLGQFARGVGSHKVRVIALMKYDSRLTVPQRYNYQSVYRFLYQQTKSSWDLVRPQIDVRSGQIQVSRVHWINNSLVADVTPEGLRNLSQISQIEKIYLNGHITYDRPVSRSNAFAPRLTRDANGPVYPYDLIDMGVDKLMAQRPDILGQGVKVGLIDTGVDGKHPALAGKIDLFFDAASGQIKEPYDSDSHGTHTSGTILGGDRDKLIFGMAPQARLVASAALSGYDDMIKAMEFMLDPDQNPQTNDAPRLVSNSWNTQGAPDQELFYRAISAWEAAGILTVFSAGNAGPKPQSITRPHEHPNAFAVAATGKNGLVADFSSRGPGIFKGQPVQKPDLSAPGVDIVSTVPGGKMQAMSGTSMACPHVAGLAALIYQVNPQLNPTQVREVILRNLNFVDPNGNPTTTAAWNPNYGYGKANALAAVQMAAGLRNFPRQRVISSMLPQKMFQLADLASPLERAQEKIFNLKPDSSTVDLFSSYPTSESNWIQIQ